MVYQDMYIYFLFGQVLLYRGHLGSYCRKAVHLVGVAQASTLQHNVGCAMLWCYFIDRVFPCVVWLNFHFIECPFALFFFKVLYQHVSTQFDCSGIKRYAVRCSNASKLKTALYVFIKWQKNLSFQPGPLQNRKLDLKGTVLGQVALDGERSGKCQGRQPNPVEKNPTE